VRADSVGARAHGRRQVGPCGHSGGGAGAHPRCRLRQRRRVEIGVAGASRYAVFETSGTLKWAAVTQDGSSNRTDPPCSTSKATQRRSGLPRRAEAPGLPGTDGSVLFQNVDELLHLARVLLVADVDADGNAEILAVANNNCGYGPERASMSLVIPTIAGSPPASVESTRLPHYQHQRGRHRAGGGRQQLGVVQQLRQNVQTDISVFAAPDLTASRCASAGTVRTPRASSRASAMVGPTWRRRR